MTVDQLAQVRNLVQQLSFQEKLYLLNDLTQQMLQQSASSAPPTIPQPLPSIHLASWPHALPLRREDLYDDRGR